MFIYALKSNLLAPHQPLQNIAKKITHSVIKRGDNGSHIMALQRSLNSVYLSHLRRGKRGAWRLLEVDGKFGGNTFAAVQGFQSHANRTDRTNARELASEFGARGSKAYQQVYTDTRFGLDADGLVGARTLWKLDCCLLYGI